MSQPSKALRIVIVDDHPVVTEGLRKIIEQQFALAEVLEFHTGASFMAHLAEREHPIDIVLLDITLPDTSGVELCREIKSLSPATGVLGFSNHDDRTLVMQLLSYGASGYLLKNVSAPELIACINDVLEGKITFSEEIRKIIARPSIEHLKTVPRLTKREKQILRMIADGKTSVEISEELSVSPFTVETHRRNLMQKFEVNNAASLIKAAAQLQLI